jgi:anhydro-N-acetylmuramic acid kinase
MKVAGVMSGTSADGIDVALVRIRRSSKRALPTLKLLGHQNFPYPADVRRRVLLSMNSPRASVADLARLNFLLGELYAEAVLETERKFQVKSELIGCHGQTLYHQGISSTFLGRELAVTWQSGEGAVVAARTGTPVVSDFRPADMAVGGKGAPLVPYLDYLVYRDRHAGRIALNLGGIANLTAIPGGARIDEVMAFDTGPGNMLIDALSEQLFGQRSDRDGKIAASGRVLEDVVKRFLEDTFFRQKPPKTAGREQFGREFAREFLHSTGYARLKEHPGRALAVERRDVVATATAFTVRSIRDAAERFVCTNASFSEVIASGGGTRNPTLMGWLAAELRTLGLELRTSDEFGIPSSAKEAVAFAVLALETWNRRPSNVPSATGASHPAVLGKVSYP